jgi:hypothetical protein
MGLPKIRMTISAKVRQAMKIRIMPAATDM